MLSTTLDERARSLPLVHLAQVVTRGNFLLVAWREPGDGSGLGAHRWVVERSLSWLHQNRRLRVGYERRADIHEAFMIRGCTVICWNVLNHGFCFRL